MIYPIIVYGDPILRQRAHDVKEGEVDLKALVADMYETMYAARGVGLAAPQIGKSLRVFVVDGSVMDNEPELEGFKQVFVNPVIVDEQGDPWPYEEGCLSIPNIREDVERRKKVRLRYVNEDWVPHEDIFDALKARIVQHEYDHLEGKLFIDYLTPLKKRLMKGKLADISKGKTDTEYAIKVKTSAR